MDRGLTLTEALLRQTDHPLRLQPEAGWEVGRLVLAPEYRSDPEALKHCLHLSLSYLSSHAYAPDLYASCSHVLSRLYRRFGFRTFAQNVALQGTEKTYTLIQGHAPEVLAALAPRGVESSALRTAQLQ